MKKLLLILLLATALMSSLALSACTSNPPAGSSASMAPSVASEKTTAPPEVEKESKGTLKIGMSWAKKNDPFMYAMDDTLTEAMAAMAPEKGYDNVEWIHVIANEDAQKQAADIEDLITQKVDLIVSFAYDNEAIKSSITSAHAAGIPFICYDRDVTEGGEQPDAFVGMDTTAQAYTTGVALFQAMKDEGVVPTDVISIIGALSDQNAVNRINGFKKAADEYGVTIKQEVPSEWNVNTALQGFSAAFQGNPNCNTVLLASDDLIASVQSVLEKCREMGSCW